MTVVRKDGDGAVPIADVYELNYQGVLTAAYRRRLPALQAIQIAFMLLANLGRLLASVRARGKTPAEKLQVVYAGFLFLVIASYVPILVVGVVATGLDIAGSEQTTPSAPTDASATGTTGGAVTGGTTDAATAQETGWGGRVLEWAQFAIIFFTAIGLFNRGSLKEFLSETAAHAIPAMGYLDYDQRKGLVLGQLNELLEHIQEKDTQYRRVHIVGYSFGSVVALDAVFPHHVPGARLSTVHSITTIGCPFDFMRTYWPDYFTDRRPLAESSLRWINIYSSMDILSSDFKDYTKRGRNVRNRGIGLARVGADDSATIAPGESSVADPPQERWPDANLRWGAPVPNGNLHKRYTLPQKVITHLFVGEVSGNSFGGMHSEAVKTIGGDIKLHDGWPAGQLARRQAGLSYWANVQVRINGTWYGPGMSSFFPWPQAAPRWTKENIIMWIEQALTNPADKDRPSHDGWTQSPRAIRKTDTGGMLQSIRINKIPCKVLYQDGVIASIYPKVPD